jgi:hypothetical protein
MMRGRTMGDFNSYFFFATAAGLTAAAIAIAIVSAFEHFRDSGAVPRPEPAVVPAVMGETDVGVE